MKMRWWSPIGFHISQPGLTTTPKVVKKITKNHRSIINIPTRWCPSSEWRSWGSHNSNFTWVNMVDIPNYITGGLCSLTNITGGTPAIGGHHLADVFLSGGHLTGPCPGRHPAWRALVLSISRVAQRTDQLGISWEQRERHWMRLGYLGVLFLRANQCHNTYPLGGFIIIPAIYSDTRDGQ